MDDVTDFRPINLVGGLYKFLANFLVSLRLCIQVLDCFHQERINSLCSAYKQLVH